MRTLLGLVWDCAAVGCCHKREVLCSETDRCEGGGGTNGPKITAPFVLGQPDERSNFWPSGLNNPTAVALTSDGKLVVADRGNDRILIWNSVPHAEPASRPTLC